MLKYTCLCFSFVLLAACSDTELEQTKSKLTTLGESSQNATEQAKTTLTVIGDASIEATEKTKETLTTIGETSQGVLHKSAMGLEALGNVVLSVGGSTSDTPVAEQAQQDSRVYKPNK